MARAQSTRTRNVEVAKAEEDMEEYSEPPFGFGTGMDDIRTFLWTLERYWTVLEIGLGST